MMTSVWASFTAVATWLKGYAPSKNSLLLIGVSALITWGIVGFDGHYARVKSLMPGSVSLGPFKIVPSAPGIIAQPPPVAVSPPVVAVPIAAPSVEQRLSALESEVAELQTHVRKPRVLSK
jgi:hypothetical protein